MKKVTTMLVLVLSVASLSTAYAQTSCRTSCEEGEKQCLAKNTKMDFWGNKLVTPEGEKACLESSRQCRKDCLRQNAR